MKPNFNQSLVWGLIGAMTVLSVATPASAVLGVWRRTAVRVAVVDSAATSAATSAAASAAAAPKPAAPATPAPATPAATPPK